MESNYLLEKPINSINSVNYIYSTRKYSIIVIIIFIFITIMIISQVLVLFYITQISDAAKNLKMYQFNNTEIIEYVNKAETIITYVCDKLIKC